MAADAGTIRELISVFGFDIDDKAIDQANVKIDGMKKRMEELGKKATDWGKWLNTRVTLPLVAMAGGMVKLAADAAETKNKFDEIFKGIGSVADQTANQLADSFDLSRSTAQELLSTTGDLLVGLKLPREEALRLSNSVVALSADVASFKNVQGGTARASEALTKALLGEREMLKSTFGTAVMEEEVQKRAAAIRQKNRKLTEQQAKVYATLAIVTERNADAIGDFARTQASASNQFRGLWEDIKDVGIAFGDILLPPVVMVVGWLRTLLKAMKDLDEGTRTMILVFGGIAAALGPGLIMFGAMAKGIALVLPWLASFAAAWRTLGIAALWAQLKLLLIPLAIAAIGTAIFLIAEDIISFGQGRDSVIGRMFIGLQEVFNRLTPLFDGFSNTVKLILAALMTPLRFVMAAFQNIADVFRLVGGKMSIKEFGGNVWERMKGVFNIGAAAQNLPSLVGPGTAGFVGTMAARAEAAKAGNMEVSQKGELNVNVTGLPPEAAKEAAESSISSAMNGILRDTMRSARPAMER